MKRIKQLLAVAFVMAIVVTGLILVTTKDQVHAAENEINSEMLNVKVQISKTGDFMRFVSSVDSLDYANVGFVVTKEGETPKTHLIYTVFERIESQTAGVVYSFSPKIVDTSSNYFVTAKMEAEEGKKYTVQAFVTPLDGDESDRVYGQSRCVSLDDGKTNVLNFNVDAVLNKQENYTAEYTNTNGTKVTIPSNNVEVLHNEEKYTCVRLNQADTDIKSATKITIKNAAQEVVETAIVRNHYTEYAGTADTSWYEICIEDDPMETEFVIASNADLYGLAALVNGNNTLEKMKIYLISDVDMNELDAVDWATGTVKGSPNNWTPIGTYQKAFDGTFDGGMHIIRGLYMKDAPRFAGLFGAVGTHATIKNFRLEDSYCESQLQDFGSIIGIASGTMEQVYSSATVKANNERVGGMIGQISTDGIILKNCWFDGSMTNTTVKLRGTGGIAGYGQGSISVTGCLNSGSVDVTAFNTPNDNNANVVAPRAGGFFGEVKDTATATIDNCLNVGKIIVGTSTTGAYGPIVGWRFGNPGTIKMTNTYATAESCKVFSQSNCNTEGVDKVVSVAAANISEAEVLETMGNLNWNEYWEAMPEYPVLKCFAEHVIDTSWYSDDKDTFVLYDRADLYGLASLVNKNKTFEGKTVKLGGDIVLNTGDAKNWKTRAPKYNWTPIGTYQKAFDGTFDGGMHTISGMYLNTTSRFVGLFGATGLNATIQNLVLKNSYVVSTNDDAASVAAYGNGTFDTIYSDAIIDAGGSRCGGLLAQAVDVTVNNCWFNGNITTTKNTANSIGGIAGYSAGTNSFTNCYNTGCIDATEYTTKNKLGTIYPSVGGIIGASNGTNDVHYSLNLGEIKADENVDGGWGAVVGHRNGGTVDYTKTYVSNECIANHEKTNVLNYIKVSEDSIKGTSDTVKETLSHLFAEINAGNWSLGKTETDFPVLTVFQDLK